LLCCGSFTNEPLKIGPIAAGRKNNYLRFCVAEHHGMTAVASSATIPFCCLIWAQQRQKIRIGSGGVMATKYSLWLIA